MVKGKILDDSRIEFAGVPLRCDGAQARCRAPMHAISIRPHDVKLSAAAADRRKTSLPATVVRQVFLGGSRDYMVEVEDGTQLRVITAAAEDMPPGTACGCNCRRSTAAR